MDALMLLALTVRSVGYHGAGDFTMDAAGRLKRRSPRTVAPFVWTTVQICHPRLFADPPAAKFSTNVVWDRAIAAGRLYGQRLDGDWLEINTPEAVEAFKAGAIDWICTIEPYASALVNDVKGAVMEAAQLSMAELERLIRRLMDQQQRRSN